MTVKHYAMELEPLHDSFDGAADLAPAAAAEYLARTATRLVRTVDRPPVRVRVQQGDTVVELEWPQEPTAAAQPAPSQADAGLPFPSDQRLDARHVNGAAAADGSEQRLVHITAPMVGTFYHAPEPGAAPFVRVGDLVEKGQHIGIVEAMKLMNPIQAEQAGRVVDVLVGNGQAVEYDQPLIALEPLESADLHEAEAAD
ncbi:acetyl-CoA carboxylase biotin carboxyl carrier protein [Streptomyces sp. RB6PN25]|uniref:Biotin carboxyl carrier protein of acetyl-CoA carboxylase n=1 Tax=Streptomyces humicola TaxID=2953240 RepID=A0ABT1PPK9_9ACTN|nr:acetyl-CoA carboxylase biotin carboxyl carrier protein [Streptomyces humicola]MCQ4079611.1 acetyl-CoA carboxylase biotin carboxyl carrier protein [Streptomyces humicola]